MKYLVLVIYDVVDDKRRNRVSKVLKGYGFRVQRSAYECNIDGKNYNELLKKLEKLIVEKEDLLRIYKLNSTIEVVTYGSIGKMLEEPVIVI